MSAKLTILGAAGDLADVDRLGKPAESGRAKGRVCGDCRLCCKVLEVPEFSKEPGKWCSKIRGGTNGACSIYETRPESCRAFRCMWLDGFFEDRDRPDRSRLVLVEALDDDGNVRQAPHPQTKTPFALLYAFEAHRGAIDQSGALLAKTMLAAGVALAVMDEDGERIREIRFPQLVEQNGTDGTVKIAAPETKGNDGPQ